MSDTTMPDTLSTEDSMAFNFLNRAANAIVSASTLSKQMEEVGRNLAQANDALSILEDIKRTQQERISLLEEQLRISQDAEARAVSEVGRLTDVVSARQRDIDILDAHVAKLTTELAETKSERDDYGLKHMEAVDNLTATQSKLDTITDAMRKVGFDVKAIVPDKPEPTHADYAENDPGYRSEPIPPVPLSEAMPPQPPSEGGMARGPTINDDVGF